MKESKRRWHFFEHLCGHIGGIRSRNYNKWTQKQIELGKRIPCIECRIKEEDKKQGNDRYYEINPRPSYAFSTVSKVVFKREGH